MVVRGRRGQDGSTLSDSYRRYLLSQPKVVIVPYVRFPHYPGLYSKSSRMSPVDTDLLVGTIDHTE